MKHTHAAKEAEQQHETAPDAAPATPSEQSAAPAQKADPAAEMLAHAQRLQAEFDNYRKRADADVANAVDRGRDKTIRELLPVLDAFALARSHALAANAPASGKDAKANPHKPAASEESEVSKGLNLIHNQLKKLLEEWHVTEIPATGIVDTRLHEVYITETLADKPAGTILQVLQPGYVRNGTVLRTAKVKAARN